ncbi:MAG: prepilin-type N-terminal cleavage/methylation domain-containing protein [Acidimicrobiales bacterium]
MRRSVGGEIPAPLRGRLRSSDVAPEAGFSLVELVVAMAILLVIMAVIPPLLETTTTVTSNAEGTVAAAAQARLAIENLEAQVGSAAAICLPTQLASSGTTATSGFAVRVEQVVSASTTGAVTTQTTRWEQWVVNTSANRLEEEQFVPGQPGQLVTVARSVVNSSVAPFSLPTPVAGSPQSLAIDLQLRNRSGRLYQSLVIKSSVAAFDTPYGMVPTTTLASGATCLTVEPSTATEPAN